MDSEKPGAPKKKSSGGTMVTGDAAASARGEEIDTKASTVYLNGQA